MAEPVAGTLSLHVLTPTGAAASAQVAGVTAPGLRGELGILPRHVPLLAALRPGVVEAQGATPPIRLAVSAGYLEVGAGDVVEILVSQAARPEDVNVEATRTEIDALEADLKLEGADLAGLGERIEYARARLAVAATPAAAAAVRGS